MWVGVMGERGEVALRAVRGGYRAEIYAPHSGLREGATERQFTPHTLGCERGLQSGNIRPTLCTVRGAYRAEIYAPHSGL